jgi:hypothetical protein
MLLHHSAAQQGSLQAHAPWDHQINFGSLSPHNGCLSSVPYFGNGWCSHILPIFLRKLVNHFLLGSLLAAFYKALVFAVAMVLLREPKATTLLI